jgi:hypothetical protein
MVNYPRDEAPLLRDTSQDDLIKHREAYDRFLDRWNKVRLPQGQVRELPPTLLDTMSARVKRSIAVQVTDYPDVSKLTDKAVEDWIEETIGPRGEGADTIRKCSEAWKGMKMPAGLGDCAHALRTYWSNLEKVIINNGGLDRLLLANEEDDEAAKSLKKRMNKLLGQHIVATLCPKTLSEQATAIWQCRDDYKKDVFMLLKYIRSRVEEMDRNGLYQACKPEKPAWKQRDDRTPSKRPSKAKRDRLRMQQRSGQNSKPGTKRRRSEYTPSPSEASSSPSPRRKPRTLLKDIEKKCKRRGTKCDHCKGPHWVSMCPKATKKQKSEYAKRRRSYTKYESWEGLVHSPNRNIDAERTDASCDAGDRRPQKVKDDVGQDPIERIRVRCIDRRPMNTDISVEFIRASSNRYPAILDSGCERNLLPMGIASKLLRTAAMTRFRKLDRPIELILGDNKTTIRADEYAEVDIKVHTPSGQVVVRNWPGIIWDVPSREVILGNTFMKDLGIDPNGALDRIVTGPETPTGGGGASSRPIQAEGQDETACDKQPQCPGGKSEEVADLHSDTGQSSSAGDPEDPEEDAPIGTDTDEEVWQAMKRMFRRARKNGLPRSYHRRLWQLIVKRRNVWRVRLSKDGPVKVKPFMTHKKPGAEPVRCAQRTYRRACSDYMQEFVSILLENGMVKENPDAQWASPAVVVRKPNGEYRMVVDLREVNARSIPTACPMPLLEGIIQYLAKSKFWFILDAFKGFWLMPLAKECQEMMSFMTDRGVYTPLRSLQGAMNSAPQFQARMTKMFEELLWEKLVVWMDDILGHSDTLEGWFRVLERTLEIAEEYNLKLNVKKCQLFTPEVKFCGRIFSEDGVRHDLQKIKALVDLPRPKTARELQQFIFGSQWMSRHVPGYAGRVYPLNTLYEQLMSKMPKRTRGFAAKVTVGDKWTQEHMASFHDVKQGIARATRLAYPDAGKPKVVIADASELACAGFVTQIPASDRTKHPGKMEHQPLGFWSHRFQGSERNWTMTVKEGFAIKGTMFALRYCFIPSQYRSILVTDHKNLIALADSNRWSKPTSEMLERWIQQMQRIPYDILHISGDDNYFADIMSRWGYIVPQKVAMRSVAFRKAMDETSARVRPLQKEDFKWPDLAEIQKSQLKHLQTLLAQQQRKGGRDVARRTSVCSKGTKDNKYRCLLSPVRMDRGSSYPQQMPISV